jgi:hypothetical protein
MKALCCTRSDLFVAHFTNSLHCGEQVWLQGYLPRRDKASGMRAHDPTGEVSTIYIATR